MATIDMTTRRGFTLIEVMIAITLLSVLTAGLYTFLSTTENALYENEAMSVVEGETMNIVEKICDDLLKCSDSAASNWSLSSTGFSADIIDGYDYDTGENTYGDSIAWSLAYASGETGDGEDNNGNNLSDEMTLTRTVNGVSSIISDHVVENGFNLSKTGKVITISLSLQAYVRKTNKTVSKTISPITVTLRN